MPAYMQVLAALLGLLALRAASEAAPTSDNPPVRCAGTRRAAVCDSAGRLARRETQRLLRAAARLARLRCGAVLIVVGARQTPSDKDATDACTVTVHGAVVSVAGRALGAAERAAAQRRLRARVDAEWALGDALVDVLRALSRLRRDESADHGRRWLACGALVLIAMVWGGCRGCIAATHLRPHYERCRRALKRLDDVRARAKALKFTTHVCPICLDVLPTAAAAAPRALASTVCSAHPARRGARRARAPHDDMGSNFSHDTASTSSGDDDAKRRTLPCGHAFHEHCLLRWVASPARNRASCPVCRTPASGACGAPPLPPPPFTWRAVSETLVSDNLRREPRRPSLPASSSIVFEETSVPRSAQAEGGTLGDGAWDLATDHSLARLSPTSALPPSPPASSPETTSQLSTHDLSSYYAPAA